MQYQRQGEADRRYHHGWLVGVRGGLGRLERGGSERAVLPVRSTWPKQGERQGERQGRVQTLSKQGRHYHCNKYAAILTERCVWIHVRC